MFPSTKPTPRPAPRLVNALRLVRSFLLLEDDHDVDWEASQDEHPHRRAVGPQRRERRPGAIEAREQVCSCPLPARAKRQAGGGERRHTVGKGASRGTAKRP